MNCINQIGIIAEIIQEQNGNEFLENPEIPNSLTNNDITTELIHHYDKDIQDVIDSFPE